MEAPPTIVHLVHGTWPYGPFRRRPKRGAKPAWFEKRSAVLRAFEKNANVPIEFRTFLWSGKNSHTERRLASSALHTHLQKALEERPDTRHVVIAHSHGGTVAASCLASQSILIPGTPRIKALICLASPFTYLHEATTAEEESFTKRIARAVGGLIIVFALFRWPDMTRLHMLALCSIYVLVYVFTVLLVIALVKFEPRHGFEYRAIHRLIPTFVLRGTRDEAALTIGVTQAMNMFLRVPLTLADSGWSRKLTYLPSIPGTILSVLMGIVGLIAVGRLFEAPEFSTAQIVFLFWLVADLVAISLAFAGYAVAALAVGFFDFRAWPRTVIEVDAAPQMKEVSFKSYSDIGDVEAVTLRHGLYENHGVQREIGLIIRSVSKGETPKLLSEEEADLELESAQIEEDQKQGRTKTLLVGFIQKEDVYWGSLDPEPNDRRVVVNFLGTEFSGTTDWVRLGPLSGPDESS
jgi:hypothetical protein